MERSPADSGSLSELAWRDDLTGAWNRRYLRRLLDEEYPGRVLIAEANQWPEDLLPYFGDGDEFQVCFHFPIMPRLYMALKRGDKVVGTMEYRDGTIVDHIYATKQSI